MHVAHIELNETIQPGQAMHWPCSPAATR